MLAERTRLAQGFSSEHLAEALDRHARCLAGGPGRVLKRGDRTQLSAVTLASGRELCVKEYRPRSLARRLEDLVRPAPPLREWRAAEVLAQRGMAAPAVYALVLPAPLGAGSAYVVMESIAAAVGVNRYALRATAAERRRLVDAVATFLASLHARGVSHADLKGSNLLVRERRRRLRAVPGGSRGGARPRRGERGGAHRGARAAERVHSARRDAVRARCASSRATRRRPRAPSAHAGSGRSRRAAARASCVWDPDYRGFELRDPPGPA